MPSAKKQRGRQRKAAAAAAAAAATPRSERQDGGRTVVATGGRIGGRRREYDIALSEPGEVTEAISRGDRLATEFVVYDLCGDDGSISDIAKAFLEHLVDDGLIRIVLGFVDQCQRASVAEVVNGQGAPINEVASNPVVEPSIWTNLLSNVVVPDGLPTKESTDRCRLELAHGIGPLISCFRYTSKEFFKSKKHWYHGLQSFMYLINNIAMANDAVGVLFEQKGLDDMVVQSLFLGTHRPDIVEESKAFGRLDFQHIARACVDILALAIASWQKRSSDGAYFDECAMRRLNIIGRTPIVSKPYRTNGRVPLVIGMIEQLQSGQYHGDMKVYCSMLHAFISLGCVDKDVISAALRSAHILEYNAAVMVTKMMVDMLNPMVNGEPTPCDNKFAYAIDRGLLIVSLILLGEHQNESDGRLVAVLQTLLETAFSISVQMKSSKAIARQRSEVLEVIRGYKRALANKREDSQKVLRLVKMIVLVQENIESYTRRVGACHWCREFLTEEEIKRCSRCGTCYCSRRCQRQDWEDGSHAARCCANDTMASVDKTDEERASEKAAKRQGALDGNVCAVAKKLVNENHLGLLNEFALLENDALDCVVLINLVRPPVMTVVLASTYLRRVSDFSEQARLRQIFDINRANGAVTTVTFRISICGPYPIERTAMGHRHPTGSWRDALEEFKKGERTTGVSDSDQLFFGY